MRGLCLVVLVVVLGGTVGCNEIVSTTGERATLIDVVGEPSDPTPDSMQPADIVGAEQTAREEGNSVADLDSVLPSATPSTTKEPNETEVEAVPDVVGGQAVAKPVSLKKPHQPTTLERK